MGEGGERGRKGGGEREGEERGGEREGERGRGREGGGEREGGEVCTFSAQNMHGSPSQVCSSNNLKLLLNMSLCHRIYSKGHVTLNNGQNQLYMIARVVV